MLVKDLQRMLRLMPDDSPVYLYFDNGICKANDVSLENTEMFESEENGYEKAQIEIKEVVIIS